jgi:hypothetical protein
MGNSRAERHANQNWPQNQSESNKNIPTNDEVAPGYGESSATKPWDSAMRAAPQPADEVFIRLMRDVTLAKQLQKQIENAITSSNNLDMVKELERRAWTHLCNYVAAIGFACDTSSER